MDGPRATFDNLDPQKRARVLEESCREFAQRGYHSASLNRIVARLDIAKGSLFQYFGSKEGLFRHLFRLAVDEIKAPLKAIRDDGSGDGFQARLWRVFAASAAFAQAHPNLWGIYRRLLAQEDFPLRTTLLSEVRGEALDFFRELVAQGQSRGEVRPDLDPAVAAFIIEAALDRALAAQGSPLLDAGLGLSGGEREARLQALTQALCAGFCAPAAGHEDKGDTDG